TIGGVGIGNGSAGQRAQTLLALGQGVLDAVLNRVAGTLDDIEKLVPGIGLPEFELHPTGLLAGPAPPAAWRQPRESARRHRARVKMFAGERLAGQPCDWPRGIPQQPARTGAAPPVNPGLPERAERDSTRKARF